MKEGLKLKFVPAVKKKRKQRITAAEYKHTIERLMDVGDELTGALLKIHELATFDTPFVFFFGKFKAIRKIVEDVLPMGEQNPEECDATGMPKEQEDRPKINS